MLKMWKIFLVSLCISSVVVKWCVGTDFKDFDRITYKSVSDWLQQVNEQYLVLNQFSASFAWDLIVDPNSHLYEESSELGKRRSKWQNQRCAEADEMPKDSMTEAERRMIWILCRGPKYTEYQGGELSTILNKIQNTYTETEVCLPKSFDVCINYNRIWDYTYVKTPGDEIIELDMSKVEPDMRTDHNPLNFFDGNLTEGYYVFRGVKDTSIFSHEIEVDEKIRSSGSLCLDIEKDLEKIMSGNFSALHRSDCALPQDVMLRWAWESWRLAVGPDIANDYPSAVYLMNVGAQNNGYNDIGECWREEVEIPDLENVTKKLWHKMKPYYQLLHGVVRNVLRKKYDEPAPAIKRSGPIPAHLLGNMWSQDWSAYHKLLTPFSEVFIDDSFQKTNWSNLDMVTRAEDFFTSMGLNPMTKKFWENSKFDKTTNNTKCHGSAGNMFTGDDYRMIVCAERTLSDFYVIVHEMGHIVYYMHIVNQPPLFQDATNSAFGEAIGDAIFLGMLTPQHLNRLGLLDDKFLAPTKKVTTREMRVVHETREMPEFVLSPRAKMGSDLPANPAFTVAGRPYPDFDALNAKMDAFMHFKDAHDRSVNAFDLSHLLRIALEKIPHIPFEYILDQWRWKFFKGDISMENANDYFWKLSIKEQGIHPPDWVNRHDMFDVAAKYHLADNTPYVRYFLSSFLQVQIFKGLCEKTIFGKFNTGQALPMPLHRCDIYGSKRAGRLLKKALALGSSVHWSEVLHILTGTREISVQPLIEYYQPLFNWLEKVAIEYDIPVGW